jgi:hypothetical protein
MSLYNWLMANKSKEELAKMLAIEASKNAHLLNENDRLEHELFWTQVAIRPPDPVPFIHLILATPVGCSKPPMSYEQFKKAYQEVYTLGGDGYTMMALEASWQSYIRDPDGHFLGKES